jgi:phosphoribosylanthranilate isomerase
MIPNGVIKICSLRELEHAEYVVAAGADLFGLNFVTQAWRYVEPAQARLIVDEAKRLANGHAARAVGLFIGSEPDAINRIADDASLDFVQLHLADLPPDTDAIERPIIACLRPEPGQTATGITQAVLELRERGDRIAAVVLDSYSASAGGGTGQVGDWALAGAVASHFPVMLAGGLTPENVAEAIRVVGPVGVDVSSGVETNRVKDRARFIAFVANARAAFSQSLVRQLN